MRRWTTTLALAAFGAAVSPLLAFAADDSVVAGIPTIFWVTQGGIAIALVVLALVFIGLWRHHTTTLAKHEAAIKAKDEEIKALRQEHLADLRKVPTSIGANTEALGLAHRALTALAERT